VAVGYPNQPGCVHASTDPIVGFPRDAGQYELYEYIPDAETASPNDAARTN
jgi:hypothetical protein